MQTSIQKWGNSLAVRIPRAFASSLRFGPGASVEISLDDDGLRIRRVQRRYSLRTLLSKVTARNRQREVPTGAPVGRETW